MDYPFSPNSFTAVNTANTAGNTGLVLPNSCNRSRSLPTNGRAVNGQMILPESVFCPPSRCNRALASPCCQGMTPDTRGCTAGQVYTYADIVFDAKEVEGDQIKEKICVPSDECNFTAIYNGCNGCCESCPNIDERSSFKVVSYCIRVKHARPKCLLTGSDFTINNYPANDADVEHLGFDTYRIPLSGFTPDIYKASCTCDNMGTKASLIVSPNGFPVEYMMEYALCGYVTTSCGTYSFEITFEDAFPMVTTGLTSFFVKDLCLPIPRCHQVPELKTSFCFDGSLVAPEIRATCCNHLVLTDTLVITPKVLAETTVNKRVVATLCQFPDNEIYCCK